jgi:hypothetical protein
MDQKPKTSKAKKRSPKKQKITQAEQSERFIQAARDIGVDETGEEFERAFKKIATHK